MNLRIPAEASPLGLVLLQTRNGRVLLARFHDIGPHESIQWLYCQMHGLPKAFSLRGAQSSRGIWMILQCYPSFLEGKIIYQLGDMPIQAQPSFHFGQASRSHFPR